MIISIERKFNYGKITKNYFIW